MVCCFESVFSFRSHWNCHWMKYIIKFASLCFCSLFPFFFFSVIKLDINCAICFLNLLFDPLSHSVSHLVAIPYPFETSPKIGNVLLEEGVGTQMRDRMRHGIPTGVGAYFFLQPVKMKWYWNICDWSRIKLTQSTLSSIKCL